MIAVISTLGRRLRATIASIRTDGQPPGSRFVTPDVAAYLNAANAEFLLAKVLIRQARDFKFLHSFNRDRPSLVPGIVGEARAAHRRGRHCALYSAEFEAAYKRRGIMPLQTRINEEDERW